MGGTGSKASAEVGLAVEKREYYAGEVVKGYVQATVRKPIKLKGIYVEMACVAHTKVLVKDPDSPGGIHQMVEDCDLMPTTRIHVARGTRDKAKPGLYQFQFSFIIPKNAPPSTVIHDEKGCFASVTYFFRVLLSKTGQRMDFSRQYWFRVFSLPPKPPTPIAITGAKSPLILRSLFLGNSVKVTVALDRNAYRIGDKCKMEIEIENKSANHVRRVEIRLLELYFVSAAGKSLNVKHKGQTLDVRFPVRPGTKRVETIPVPFGFVAPGIKSPTLKVEHKFEVKVITNAVVVKVPTIMIPVLAYGYNLDLDRLSRMKKPQKVKKKTKFIKLPPQQHPHRVKAIENKWRNAAVHSKLSRSRSSGREELDDSVFQEEQEGEGDEDGEEETVETEGQSAVPYAVELLEAEGILVAEPMPFVPDAEIVKLSGLYAVPAPNDASLSSSTSSPPSTSRNKTKPVKK